MLNAPLKVSQAPLDPSLAIALYSQISMFSRLHAAVTRGPAIKIISKADQQESGRRLNDRAENSHLPFRRHERAMQRFRSMRSLQKLAAVHASVNNHFNQQRALHSRDNFKLNRAATLAEWRQLCSA